MHHRRNIKLSFTIWAADNRRRQLMWKASSRRRHRTNRNPWWTWKRWPAIITILLLAKMQAWSPCRTTINNIPLWKFIPCLQVSCSPPSVWAVPRQNQPEPWTSESCWRRDPDIFWHSVRTGGCLPSQFRKAVMQSAYTIFKTEKSFGRSNRPDGWTLSISVRMVERLSRCNRMGAAFYGMQQRDKRWPHSWNFPGWILQPSGWSPLLMDCSTDPLQHATKSYGGFHRIHLMLLQWKYSSTNSIIPGFSVRSWPENLHPLRATSPRSIVASRKSKLHQPIRPPIKFPNGRSSSKFRSPIPAAEPAISVFSATVRWWKYGTATLRAASMPQCRSLQVTIVLSPTHSAGQILKVRTALWICRVPTLFAQHPLLMSSLSA